MADENNRKRKESGEENGRRRALIFNNDNDDLNHDLSLSLSFPPLFMNPGLALNAPPPAALVRHQVQPSRSYEVVRIRRNASMQADQNQEDEFIDPPYPWATNRRATVHSLDFLLSNEITVISGKVKCKKCTHASTLEFDLRNKFREIALFIIENKGVMHDRAPDSWTSPELPVCPLCGPNHLKPVISDSKDEINWLFLLLGQMLGLCTLEQLKYFCRYTKNHRTGAKDRVLYLTYLELCRQLDPTGPF